MQHPTPPSWRELWQVFGKIGLLSFGGPAAQIALMHREIVERKGWLSETAFLNGLGFCTLLPGPEAMQLATYTGWKLKGTWAGLLAGCLFVLPGAIVVLFLSLLYVSFGSVPLVQSLFLGIKAAVLAIVVQALIKISRKALTATSAWVLAGLSFAALFFFGVPFPLIVGVAAIYGATLRMGSASPHVASTTAVAWRTTLRTTAIWLFLWWAPLLLIIGVMPDGILSDMALFFSNLAVVSFGGAYALLAYMGQVAVETQGWLDASQMIDGLGLAETTPGPLILVTQFVGFMGGFNSGGVAMALAAVGVTLWATFVPCFLWIFAGAPYVDAISANPRLRGALSGITAAVVGVIANLALWFALHVVFAGLEQKSLGPLRLWSADWTSASPQVLALIAMSALLLFVFKQGIGVTLVICAVAALGMQNLLLA
ncbi:chromate efflux transporter [Nereida sp. MMG025]|uniref:chromate efflux transporter n=1 Tax=Nereida sp. MMG025 TaxID=2909981 RepID=UPI001EFFC1BA|nr:chromate efflux transporter [Nereida sp. MMG025]MCF6443797.1 chromate efflux transporter [Nereida sp. MMG025]